MFKALSVKKINVLVLNRLCPFLIFLFVVMSFPRLSSAAQAVIGWETAPGPVAGYDVYYGASSGNYTTTLDVGNATTAALQNLSLPAYYIAVADFSASSQMSPLSSELVIYDLNASAGTGGSISPSGSFYQSSGGSQTFTIVPASGYVISNVGVDGASVGALVSYTFSNISAAHTISATFMPSSVLWQNASNLGGGWESLSWFGKFNINNSPWIDHATLGWLYPVGTSTASLWFYDPQWDGSGGWWWTSSSAYPWIYSQSLGTWLYFDAAASTPASRLFWNSSDGKWENH
ncbi:MAG: InlB B-repeat-containing protein [Syntrophobacteraceae bacterium]